MSFIVRHHSEKKIDSEKRSEKSPTSDDEKEEKPIPFVHAKHKKTNNKQSSYSTSTATLFTVNKNSNKPTAKSENQKKYKK